MKEIRFINVEMNEAFADNLYLVLLFHHKYLHKLPSSLYPHNLWTTRILQNRTLTDDQTLCL